MITPSNDEENIVDDNTLENIVDGGLLSSLKSLGSQRRRRASYLSLRSASERVSLHESIRVLFSDTTNHFRLVCSMSLSGIGWPSASIIKKGERSTCTRGRNARQHALFVSTGFFVIIFSILHLLKRYDFVVLDYTYCLRKFDFACF